MKKSLPCGHPLDWDRMADQLATRMPAPPCPTCCAVYETYQVAWLRYLDARKRPSVVPADYPKSVASLMEQIRSVEPADYMDGVKCTWTTLRHKGCDW